MWRRNARKYRAGTGYVSRREAGFSGRQTGLFRYVCYVLKDPESWHGMRAGPDGAIVTEYATFHNHVEFSKPGMAFGSTGH